MNDRYKSIAKSAVSLAEQVIDPNEINPYLQSATPSPHYWETKKKLVQINASMPDIQYLYVYQIREDGCHVVFDLDTEETPGSPLGTLVPFDESFRRYLPDLLAGREIEPIIADGQYGWLLSFYHPIFDSTGHCVAYVAADIDMEDVRTDSFVYIIRMLSLLFGASMIILAFVLWFAKIRISEPINALTVATGRFAYDSENHQQQNMLELQNLSIHTNDEIEQLFHAIVKMTGDVSTYVHEVNEMSHEAKLKSHVISQLQDNMIVSFATLAEYRDVSTGDHIQRTSAYVREIAVGMAHAGLYPELLTPKYIESLEKSAPLHDIGKIQIPDQILKKPGRLTAEEFEIMKTHTTAGREILAKVFADMDQENHLSEAMDMATYHHEKMGW